jgi:hypothetical protein
MRLCVALVAVLAIAACTQPPQQSAATPPTSSTLPPTPSPVTDLPLSTVTFTCRLPVTKSLSGGDFASYEGGFITFPQGGYQTDPTGAIHSEYFAQDFVTVAKPELHGAPQAGPPFYDLAQKRWLPVGSSQSSPDGSAYAYSILNGLAPGPPFAIHIVDVARGTDRTFPVPTSSEFGSSEGAWIGDFDGDAVSFTSMQTIGHPQGVWSLNVVSGKISQLSRVAGVAAIENGYVWVSRIDPRDPQGAQTGRSGPHENSLVRVDLTSGQETVWYYAAGHVVGLVGVDRLGAPIISDAPPPDFTRATLRLVSKPESDGITIYDGKGGLVFFTLQSDVLGRLWLGSDRGIYVWTPAVGLAKVFAFTHDTVDAAAMAPAGLCI